MKLWVVGQHRRDTEDGAVWDFQGVFDLEKKAIKACKNPSYFIAPWELNKEAPEEVMEFPESYYP